MAYVADIWNVCDSCDVWYAKSWGCRLYKTVLSRPKAELSGVT